MFIFEGIVLDKLVIFVDEGVAEDIYFYMEGVVFVFIVFVVISFFLELIIDDVFFFLYVEVGFLYFTEVDDFLLVFVV